MNVPAIIRSAVRTLVRRYCRLVPVNAGKTQLMFHCKSLVTPCTEETLLDWGGRISTDLSDNIQRQMYFLGHYELKITRLIQRILQSGDTFVDVGANIGYYSILAGLLVGPHGRVHSFEPLPDICESLRRNIALNRLDNVTINCAALYQEESDVELYLPVTGNNGTGSIVHRPHHSGRSVTCPAVTLDGYAKRGELGPIRLIKLDIEGAEMFALKGMKEIFRSPEPPDIICEVVPDLLEGANQSPAELVQFLDTFGYGHRKIDRWNLHFTKGG